MTRTTAALTAGLLARKGEARPSAQSEPLTVSRGGSVSSFVHTLIRREPLSVAPSAGVGNGRCIELPRQPSGAVPRAQRAETPRHQVHARVPFELHQRMRAAAARAGRTQQDLVSCALETYLSSLDEETYSPPRGATNAWV